MFPLDDSEWIIFLIVLICVLLLTVSILTCILIKLRCCRQRRTTSFEEGGHVAADIGNDAFNGNYAFRGISTISGSRYADAEGINVKENNLEIGPVKYSGLDVSHAKRQSVNTLTEGVRTQIYARNVQGEPQGGQAAQDVGLPNDGEWLVDSELQELMVPDMKEDRLIEIRSKLLVFISRKIDHTGGQLVLDKMGISLFIPPCAIEAGRTETIFLALNWDLGDFPNLTNSQSIVSPVVHVGPHGINLNRPVTLSFRHCAFNVNDVKVYSSETHLMQEKSWIASPDEQEYEHQHTILDTECQVHISHFTLYTCIAEGESSKKWLQLVAFGGLVGSHYEVRVYILNNTPCALQFAFENEKKNRFEQIKCPQEYLFSGDGSNMCIEVGRVNEGWSTSFTDNQETIPFLSIWHGKCPFATFIFKHENKTTNDISITLLAYQKNDNGHKLSLKLLAELTKCNRRKHQNSENQTTASGRSSFRGVSPFITNDFDPGDPTTDTYSEGSQQSYDPSTISLHHSHEPSSFVIPHKLKMALNNYLAPSGPFGNDWRMIASDLGMDSKIPILQEKESPFLEVLKIMEMQKKDLNWLSGKLTYHGRMDAVSVLNHYLHTGEILNSALD